MGLCRGLGALTLLLLSSTAHGSPKARPFSVVDVGKDTIIFHRPREGGPGEEGFVIDSRALVSSLKARVLEARGLGEVVDVSTEDSDSGRLQRKKRDPEKPAAYTFSHRFAAPFDSVRTELRLRPLGEPDEGALLNQLGWALAAFIVAGLFAVYRMSAGQVAFAERRSNFVSAVSHELKTPLTAIRMYGEMLQEGLVEDPGKQQEYYRTITSESERLTRLINNVLALSRIEQRQKLPLRAGDVRPVIREVVDVLRPHADREGFTLEVELHDEVPHALFEPDALRQVLFNLIDNALKYSHDARDKRVTVEVRRTGQGAVSVSVRDRGPGVPKDRLGHIFEPFYRVEQELTRKHQGTGIGLALVEGIARAMRAKASARLAHPGLEVRLELAVDAEDSSPFLDRAANDCGATG